MRGKKISGHTCVLAVIAVLAGAQSTANGGTGGHPTCDGIRATIVGTPDDDVIEGTTDQDIIVGLGGDDRIRARKGFDFACGGRGDDIVRGNGTFDVLLGGRGRDRLIDRPRRTNHLLGGPGDDQLYGGNYFWPGRGDDVVRGEGPAGTYADPGDDLIVNRTGQGSIRYGRAPRPVHADLRKETATGWGNDTLIGIRDVLGSAHDDVLIGSSAGERFFGSGGFNRLHGRAGNDQLEGGGIARGGAGDDHLRGRDTDDLLDGGGGTDTLDGRRGIDECLEGENVSNCEL
ncbi:MAG: calcium-binding protein [Solirubrobacterales bacterium]